MNYIEIKISFSQADPWKDVFTTLLAEAGCDSFMEGDEENILLAYIPEKEYKKKEKELIQILSNHSFDVQLHYTFSKVEAQDWNAVWESNYEPVLIGKKCYVRAPFHETMPEAEYQIIIEPKMSFGTAHHETTSLMVEYLLEENVKGKAFLDMGAGTGILAILAYKKGARPVVAIDNDEWAYRNNIENNRNNDVDDMKVILGDASAIPDMTFDILFANINRNILLNDIPAYSNVIPKGGLLFMSGFYREKDLDLIIEKCSSVHLQYISHKEKNNWVAAKFVKE